MTDAAKIKKLELDIAKARDREALLRFYLKRIREYMTPEQLRRHAEKNYGLPYEEALEMAYDNIREEAHNALRTNRKARAPSKRVAEAAP